MKIHVFLGSILFFGCFLSEESESQLKKVSISLDSEENEYDQYQAKYCEMENFCGSFTDSRDGQLYKWVRIDTLKWLKSSLNFQTSNSQCIDSGCGIKGRLYSWAEAMNVDIEYSSIHYSLGIERKRGLCPEGWRVPTVGDFLTLTEPYSSLWVDLAQKGDNYFFNPNHILGDWSVDLKSAQESFTMPEVMYSSRQWPYRGTKDPFEFGLLYDNSLRLLTADEDPENPNNYMAYYRVTDSQASQAFLTSMKKASESDEPLNQVRCVQSDSRQQTIQFWIKAVESKWGILMTPDESLGRDF